MDIGNIFMKTDKKPPYLEIPIEEEKKLSDSYVFPSNRKKSLSKDTFVHSTVQSRQAAQAKAAKLLLMQELNYEEVSFDIIDNDSQSCILKNQSYNNNNHN